VNFNRLCAGLKFKSMIWAAEVNFDPGSICLVMASDFYEESDYIRNYADFTRLVEEQSMIK